MQAHALAEINRAKYGALRSLYVGLQLMTLMGVGTRRARLRLVTLGAPANTAQGRRRSRARAHRRHPAWPSRRASRSIRRSSSWFVVGDEGSLAELDSRRGASSRVDAVPGNLEGVTVHGPSGALLLLPSSASELVVWDPVAHREQRRIRLDRAALLGRAEGDVNNGFEGWRSASRTGAARSTWCTSGRPRWWWP